MSGNNRVNDIIMAHQFLFIQVKKFAEQYLQRSCRVAMLNTFDFPVMVCHTKTKQGIMHAVYIVKSEHEKTFLENKVTNQKTDSSFAIGF